MQTLNNMIIHNPGDGIWNDGEWISWAYINSQLEEHTEGGLLEELIVVAKEYYEDTGRHLPIYGELGELYAERRFGIERHEPHTQGSDGRIGNMLVEIKTISPIKQSNKVRVKRLGNFGALVIVKIDADFRIDAKLIKRKRLPKGDGKYITVSWDTHKSDHLDI